MNSKRKFTLLLLLAVGILQAIGQQMNFSADGTFKVVQFTDTHISPMKEETEVVFRLIEETLKAENPNLVLFTGDVVTNEPAKDGWERLLALLNIQNIPFCILNGNHDHELKLTPQQISELIVASPLSINKILPNGYLADQVLEVCNPITGKTEALLYCMDSKEYSTLKSVKGYGWFSHEQISWYRAQSTKYKIQNNNSPLPALAFFHIPLPEYSESVANNGLTTGIRLENECPPSVNSGMFTAMLEQGDVMGAFVGHDHVNDYLTNHHGIALAYGRASGGKTTYGDLMPGARVITLHQGESFFSTYIRLLDGRILSRYASSTNPKRDVTFAVVADLHFDLLPESDQYYHVRTLNNLAGNFVWNAQSDFAEDTLKNLSSVIVAGDTFDKALPETHALYKARYHQGGGDKTIHYPVFPGYGNHDINPVEKNKKENLKGRAMNLAYMDSILNAKLMAGEILNFDSASRCYSWTIDDVHFVQMQTYAGDESYAKCNSLAWLENDLKRYAPGNTPVVYIQHYGFDQWAIKWWPADKRERLFDILDQHRLVAFFVGHTHSPSIQYYRGYPIYQVNNSWPDKDGKGSFAVARMKGDKLSVINCRWIDDQGNFELVEPYISSSAVKQNKWMSAVPDDTRLCKMGIPGTHDSGAIYGGEALKTQDCTLPEQLAWGVRAFDIRLKAIEGGKLGVYHGDAFQHLTWEDDLQPLFTQFVANNPSEVLLISLKCEGGSREEYRSRLQRSLN
ncbi:MAG: metallophosphoesterase, partial [Phocaeicola sp.]